MKILFLSLLIFIGPSLGYKILAYSPKLWKSHMIFTGKIADILAKAGHDVTLYQPIFDDNITITGVSHAKVIERPRDFIPEVTMYDMETDVWLIGDDLCDRSVEVGSMLHTLCSHQINDEEMMNRLKDEKFDLAIGEVFDGCFYGVIEKAQIPAHISLAGTPMPDLYISLLGIPTMFSFVPSMAYGRGVSTPMDYFERIKNIYHILDWFHRMQRDFIQNTEQAVSKSLGRKFSVKEKMAESAFYFVNVDEFLDFPRPLSSKYIYIGGMPEVAIKPLEKKYAEIFEASQRGVIFISFGTIAKSSQMPANFLNAFLAVFEVFQDVTFMMKYEEDGSNITSRYKNVFAAPWLDQLSILSHPKLLGFISHGGLNSITESIIKGVPTVCIPLFADQLRNCEMMKYRKASVKILKAKLNSKSLVDAVDKILNDPSYRRNAQKLAHMISTKPQSSEERIIKYAEFAAEFGNDNNLDIEGRHLNVVQYYCLDIIFPIALLLYVVVYYLSKVLLLIVKRLIVLEPKFKIE